MNLNRDFKEFVESLIAHDVRFLIVGGYAVAAHGHPRYTKDLDVWVGTAPSNTDRLMSALEDLRVDDLRTNKLATGRLQDLADAEALKRDLSS